MSNINVDVTSKMLAAIVFEPENINIATDIVNYEEQVSFLKKYINTVSTDDRKDIGRLLIMHDKKSALVNCSEGVVINLDNIPKDVVREMYDMLKCKIEKLSQ